MEIPDTMIFKLLQGKSMEKIECKAKNCYEIGVDKYPSMKEMEERADILAKLLILYNRDEYPTQGDITSNTQVNRGGNFRNSVLNRNPGF